MHLQVNHLLFILPFICCVLAGQKNYIVQQRENGYDEQHVHSKEERRHYDESNHYEEYNHKPYPYKFGYDIKDEKGNVQYHKEEGDEYNVKKGSYGYTDAYGVYRHVDYIADHLGFRAKIRTNEPGTANYHPADVTIYSEPPPSHVYTNYAKYNDVSYQQPEHSSYDHAAQKTYRKSVKQAYNQQEHSDHSQEEHSTYSEAGHGEYNQPEHSSYSQPEHNGYNQQDTPAYGQQDHNGYGEQDHSGYGQPDHAVDNEPDHSSYRTPQQGHHGQTKGAVLKPQYPVVIQQQQENHGQIKGVQLKPQYPVVIQQQQIDQGENHPQLDHQKYTYVPVYVPNAVDYKH